jgi:hypothetical protein
MIRLLFPILLFVGGFLSRGPIQADLVNDVSAQFRGGNAKEVAKHFAASVDLSISDDADVYSKAQAEQILRDFLTKHVPQSSSVVHMINTNPNYQIGIISLATRNGKFRITVTFKKSSGVFLITELRIDPDK